MKKRCEHGLRREPLGRICTNNWCRLKYLIERELADLDELPFFTRLWVKWNFPATTVTRSWNLPKAFLSQTYRVIYYKGKEYFYKWGG